MTAVRAHCFLRMQSWALLCRAMDALLSPTNSTHMTSNYRVESVSNCRLIGRRRKEREREREREREGDGYTN